MRLKHKVVCSYTSCIRYWKDRSYCVPIRTDLMYQNPFQDFWFTCTENSELNCMNCMNCYGCDKLFTCPHKLLQSTSNISLQRRRKFNTPLGHQLSALLMLEGFSVFLSSYSIVTEMLGWACVACILLNWITELILSGLNVWVRLKNGINPSKDWNSYVLLHIFQIIDFSYSFIVTVNHIVNNCMKQSEALSVKPDR